MISNSLNIIDIVDNTLKLLESEEYVELLDKVSKSGGLSIREFKSVYLQLPRRSGHTSAAFELLSIYPSSHLIYPKHDLTRNAKREIEMLHVSAVDGARTSDGISVNLATHIHTLNHNFINSFRGKLNQHIDLVIFDCYTKINKDADMQLLDSALNVLNPITKLFVFLQ